jgi:uncharacterized protein YbaP (TraB family)
MFISRRDSLRGAIMMLPIAWRPLCGMAAEADGRSDTHPRLWWVEHDDAKVWIFGCGDSKDDSWFTPYVARAFRDSSDVWFETPQPDPRDRQSAAQKAESDREEQELTHDYEHNVFDSMGPDLAARALSVANKYGVSREDLEHTRLWYSYFVINRGFWAFRAKTGRGAISEAPDRVLGHKARQARKPIYSEFATEDAVTHFFSDMTELQQRQRLSFLLDYFDDEEAGLHKDEYDWLIAGRSPSTRNIDRMRTSYPELYQVEHVRRNKWWAEKVVQLLGGGGTYFIAHGLNHVLGPDSLLVRLRERGYTTQSI